MSCTLGQCAHHTREELEELETGVRAGRQQENGKEEAASPHHPHILHPNSLPRESGLNSHILPASPVLFYMWLHRGLYLRSSSSDPAAASTTALENSSAFKDAGN